MNEETDDWKDFWNETGVPAPAEAPAPLDTGGEGHPYQRGKVLAEAERVINGERQDAYGNPEDSFTDIADLWGWYLGLSLTPSAVAVMMALLKFAREKHQHKRDNIVDACGYLALYSDIVDRQ